MDEIIIDGVVFRQVSVNKNYYIDEYGNVYSKFSKKIIKPLLRCVREKTYIYVDIYVDGKQRHMNIHRLVYSAWVGDIPEGAQVNHKDDNSMNNNYTNLYVGNQSQNIQDCIKNEHRLGNVFYLTIYDKLVDRIMTFCPASDFIAYSGHTCLNGGIKRMFSRNWFKKRFEIIEYKHINSLSHFKSVTTNGDECNHVD